MNPAHPPATSRLSLAELCSPSPSSKPMSNDPPPSGPSSSGPSSPDDSRSVNGNRAERSSSLSEEDENVMIAVRALDDMRSRAVPTSGGGKSYQYSTSPQETPTNAEASSSSPSSNVSQNAVSDEAASSAFVTRMTGLPLVTTALRAYEQSKASSRVVKYGAEMMESSVKTISKPVIDRLPVNQIDEFACRQLDRIGRYGKTNGRDRSESRSEGRQSQDHDRNRLESEDRQTQSTGAIEDDNQYALGLQMHQSLELDKVTAFIEAAQAEQAATQDVANRSRWHNILYEAGGLGVAVSDESMRRLKYSLQWLQYATNHIDAQILILRNFIGSLNSQEGDEGGGERPVSASHMQTLTNVKRDVVNTIRQVVDVVSKYAGGALPEPARTRVRQFILILPQRWANTAHRQAHVSAQAHTPGQPKGNGKRRRRDGATEPGSAASTAPSSPLQSPSAHRDLPLPSGSGLSSHRAGLIARPTAGSATQAAQRVLTLATESLDMMRSVTGVVKESLDRAETWVERLRVVGINRQQNTGVEIGELPPRENGSDRDGSATTASTFTSFPPSPRSFPADAPSPGGIAAASIDALSLSSFATPRSSTQSLPSLVGYDWEYTTRKLQTIKDESISDEIKTIDRSSAISALRGTAAESPRVTMDVEVE